MTELDGIIAELVEIGDRLRAEDGAAERIELMERRDELRRKARAMAPSSKVELQQQLERLLAAWESLQKRRIDVVKQAGDLAAGNFGFTSDAVRLNQKIDEAAGRDELERQIGELRARIAALEG